MKSMKLSYKLAGGFGSLMLIAAVLGIANYYSSNRSAQSVQNLTTNKLPAVQAVLTMKDAGNISMRTRGTGMPSTNGHGEPNFRDA
jgi:CHASE3 domain sensor protein